MKAFFSRKCAAFLAVCLMAFSLSACDEALLDQILYYELDTDITFADSVNPNEGREGPFEIVKVVDGDTIKLMIDGEKKNVRLIGVDTPESVHPDETKNVPEGVLASEHTKELIGDTTELYLEYGTEPQDRYGRPLCYVYLPDGTMLNRQLLEDGYADVLIVGKNKEYKEEFTAIRDEAKAEERGLWPTGVFDDE